MKKIVINFMFQLSTYKVAYKCDFDIKIDSFLV